MKHLVKRGGSKPTVNQLDDYQLGFDYTNGDLYIKNPNFSDEIVNIGGKTISGEISAISGYINQVNDTISGYIENDPQRSGDGVWTDVISGALTLTAGARTKIESSVIAAEFVSGYLRLALNDNSNQDVDVVIDDGTWD
jgi:hypothetical protein